MAHRRTPTRTLLGLRVDNDFCSLVALYHIEPNPLEHLSFSILILIRKRNVKTSVGKNLTNYRIARK